MADVFVPEDTIGTTRYYIDAMNTGLLQKFGYQMADIYRSKVKERTLDELMRILPRDNTLLDNFVSYAAKNGLPARWYYIRKSRDLILNQLKAVIARDVLGYNEFLQVLNQCDPTVLKAAEELRLGNSPVIIVSQEKDKTSATPSKSKSK